MDIISVALFWILFVTLSTACYPILKTLNELSTFLEYHLHGSWLKSFLTLFLLVFSGHQHPFYLKLNPCLTADTGNQDLPLGLSFPPIPILHRTHLGFRSLALCALGQAGLISPNYFSISLQCGVRTTSQPQPYTSQNSEDQMSFYTSGPSLPMSSTELAPRRCDPPVLISYCYIANRNKLSGLKQHTFIICFLWISVWACLNWSFVLRVSKRLQWRKWSGLASPLKAQQEKNPFPSWRGY